MKSPFSTRFIKRLFTSLGSSKDSRPKGVVEVIDTEFIRGWAFHPQGTPVSLRLRIGGETFDLQPRWVERQDVSASHGINALNSGFICSLDSSSYERLSAAIDGTDPIGVLANDLPLPMVGNARNTGKKLQWDSLDISMHTGQMDSCIEAWGGFGLRGWAVICGAAPRSLTIAVAGREFPVEPVWRERKEIAQRFDNTSSRIGFEVDLPGYLWEQAVADSDLEVNLLADGQLLTPQPLRITRRQAIRWVEEIAGLPEGKERQYRALLALEHARFGSFNKLLSADALTSLRDFALRMRLEEFTLNDGVEPAATETPAESMTNLLLWKAMRTLNARITDRNKPVFDLVRSVAIELRLQGEVRAQFLIAVTPLLCSTDEFLRLRELSDFTRLQLLGNEDGNLYKMTVAVPAFVAEHKIDRASEILYRVAKNLDKGWLNTECVRYSLQLVLQQEADGEIEILAAEKFRYAVLAVLDGFKGEWFSRLHDHSLVDSMLLILSEIDRYTDYHRHDVITAALRNYGLNPAFWERAAKQKLPSLDSELARSHAHFRRIHQAFTTERRSLVNWLEEIAEPLAYFRAKKNPEAAVFQREICANTLTELNDSLTVRGKALLAEMLASDPAEALRLAAFPLDNDNRLLEAFPETAPEMLRETIRGLSEPGKSVAWHLQENASAALNTLLSVDIGTDRPAAHRALLELEQRAITLANRQGGFLAFDLLASAYILATAHHVECSPLLTRMLGVLQKATDETKSDGYLPQPILAALNRMSNLRQSGDPLLRGFLSECQTVIHAKFAKRMDKVLAPSENLQMKLGTTGWPHDTLVVIYSCRKYLETRVKTIRETWVQDLKTRGIPYVVLVGDGDDTLRDDVLALDVSDRYEDLPKKSLKLFDWVYNNTDAQYVLKIDDDCHLDVARFFDTLSYRKHFYYGRIIRCGVGGMDRAWHQSKSQTDHGRKTLDKSPEPSTYADGGGAYTLSRLAMLKLLETARSPIGERLIAVSFMEDKLIGDLLAVNFISPSNEDYDSYQRRRTFGEAMPVGKVENTFFPGLSSPIKVTHLDNHLDLASTRAKAGGRELWPKKIWQTCRSPDIKSNSNQLELLTDLPKTSELLAHQLLVISVVRNEMVMLPHFLSHYRGLGVKCFVMVDNCSDDGTREYLYQEPDVILYSSDTEYKHSHYGVAWQQAVLGNHCLGKWVLLADADELLVYEDCESKTLDMLAREIEDEGCNAAATYMADMYPFDDLAKADFENQNPFEASPWFDNPPLIKYHLGSGMFSNSSTYLSALRHRLTEHSPPNSFTSQKYGLIRYQPWIRYSQGLHDASNLTVSTRHTWFAHFKYHAGFKEKVETEIRRGQHFNNATEYRRYAAMLAEGQGKFGTEGVSTRYSASSDLVNCIGGTIHD